MAVQRIAVIGGGITGLAAAYRCCKLSEQYGTGADITVLERSPRVGGCIETRYDNGFVLEMGPDSLVTEKPAAIALANRLGLGDAIEPVCAQYRGARVVRAGRLIPIPEDFRFFTPTSLRGLVTSRLFTPIGVARAAIEPFVPARRTTVDESLASFVSRRFGREVLERLAQPLIGGIYSGDPKRLSMQATLPQLLEMELKYGSLTRGMRLAARQPTPATPLQRLVSLRGGLGTLVAALERELGESVRTSSDVLRLRRGTEIGGDANWRISLSDGSEIAADTVICALPAHAAARLLQDLEPQLAEQLRTIAYHSVATVTMAFATHDIPTLPRCTGFVVPQTEHRNILAITFSSQKYANRAPEGTTVLRAFVGGAVNPEMATREDAALIAAVDAECRTLLGIVAQPLFSVVRRFEDALPEYAVGHTAVVDTIERVVGTIGHFALAGSAYRGVGIADCVRSGERAAEAIEYRSSLQLRRLQYT